MLQVERHNCIVSEVEKQGFISIEDMINVIPVSRSTIRRDLLDLERMNKLIRTRGGAVSNKNGTSHDPGVEFRYSLQREEKQRIAEAALKLVNERDTILLDEGTTTIELAKRLNRYHSLVVATNDLYVAMELRTMDNINLVVVGGTLRHETNTLVGYFTEKIIGEIHADRFFLSADAIDLTHGCMCYNMAQIPVKKSMILAAKETVLLSDHTKFNRIALANICKLSEINTIITGREADREIVEQLGEIGVQIILV